MKAINDVTTALTLRSLSLILGIAPMSVVLPLGRLFGRLLQRSGIRAAVGRANMRVVARDVPTLELAACTHLAHALLLTLQPPRRCLSMRRRLCAPRLPSLLADLQQGGVIVASAHIGAWELLPAMLLPALPADTRATIVYRRLHNSWLERWVLRRRARLGGTFVPAGGSLPALEAALRRGELAGLVADQRPSRPACAVGVPFLGRQTAFDVGVAALHHATGAPVWFAVLLVDAHRADGLPAFQLHLQPLASRRPPGGDAEGSGLLRAYAQAVDAAVRMAPSQYFWWHRRWRAEERSAGAGELLS